MERKGRSWLPQLDSYKVSHGLPCLGRWHTGALPSRNDMLVQSAEGRVSFYGDWGKTWWVGALFQASGTVKIDKSVQGPSRTLQPKADI